MRLLVSREACHIETANGKHLPVLNYMHLSKSVALALRVSLSVPLIKAERCAMISVTRSMSHWDSEWKTFASAELYAPGTGGNSLLPGTMTHSDKCANSEPNSMSWLSRLLHCNLGLRSWLSASRERSCMKSLLLLETTRLNRRESLQSKLWIIDRI